MEGFHPLRVAAVDQLTDEAVALTFEVPSELREVFGFSPGQHLTLRRELEGEDLRRTYSVCAATTGPLRVAVKRLDGGAFSTWACKELQPGDVVEVLPPAGGFGPRLSPERARRYGLVAAGSGITPVLSIAATVLEVEPRSEVVLVYGNRTSRDVMFLEELSDLKDLHPTRLQVLHVLSREEQESELLSGRLDRGRLARVLDAFVPVDGIDEWYLCGPFGLVTAARDLLVERGAGQVHVELFHAAAPTASGGRGRRGHGRRDPPRSRLHRLRASRRSGPGRGPARALRRAVRLPGWGVRHLPRPGARGCRGDGRQLGARARRAGRGCGADLPVAPHDRAGPARVPVKAGGAQRRCATALPRTAAWKPRAVCPAGGAP
jgi:ferredoxin-NADP reductase